MWYRCHKECVVCWSWGACMWNDGNGECGMAAMRSVWYGSHGEYVFSMVTRWS